MWQDHHLSDTGGDSRNHPADPQLSHAHGGCGLPGRASPASSGGLRGERLQTTVRVVRRTAGPVHGRRWLLPCRRDLARRGFRPRAAQLRVGAGTNAAAGGKGRCFCGGVRVCHYGLRGLPVSGHDESRW
uniref:(northern house mosquito) hypothetical protein n=1 Tax=Culex pipiens TaxID=7175 RepID=A0A8D8E616_CULPI